MPSKELVDRVASAFHESYERLAPKFSYKPRPESSVPWDSVPDNNKRLMRAVVAELLEKQIIR